MTNKSDLVISGPPLGRILLRAATSITYIVKYTNLELKVAAQLSPPLSKKTRSKSVNFSSTCSIAAKFMEAYSQIGVWG